MKLYAIKNVEDDTYVGQYQNYSQCYSKHVPRLWYRETTCNNCFKRYYNDGKHVIVLMDVTEVI